MCEAFEVGKFYSFPTYHKFSVVRIPAECVAVKKRVVKFRHLSRRLDGRIVKYVSTRRLFALPDRQEAYVADTWTLIPTFSSQEVCERPENWDKYPNNEEVK